MNDWLINWYEDEDDDDDNNKSDNDDSHDVLFVTITMKLMFVLQIVFGGMMLSSGFWGKICDKYGRKTVSYYSPLNALYFVFSVVINVVNGDI